MFPYPSVHGNELKQQRFEQFIEQAISAAQHCEGSRPCALEAEGNPAPCSHCDTCHMSHSRVHRLRGSFPPMHLHSAPAYPAEGSKQLSQNSAHQTPSTQPPGCCLPFPSTRMESSNTPTLRGGRNNQLYINSNS